MYPQANRKIDQGCEQMVFRDGNMNIFWVNIFYSAHYKKKNFLDAVFTSQVSKYPIIR